MPSAVQCTRKTVTSGIWLRCGKNSNTSKKAAVAVGCGTSTRSAYERLGLMRWSNLPGSFEEVEQIRKIVPGLRRIHGPEGSEPFVKRLSRTGELAGYRVLHFATHGIVVPEIPELSAVVLSLSKSDADRKTGFSTPEKLSISNLVRLRESIRMRNRPRQTRSGRRSDRGSPSLFSLPVQREFPFPSGRFRMYRRRSL